MRLLAVSMDQTPGLEHTAAESPAELAQTALRQNAERLTMSKLEEANAREEPTEGDPLSVWVASDSPDNDTSVQGSIQLGYVRDRSKTLPCPAAKS